MRALQPCGASISRVCHDTGRRRPFEESELMSKTYILVVAHDDEVIKRAKRILERDGYRILVVADGASAVEHLRKQKPALILLYRSLPDMDGLELCRMLKSGNGSGNVPIVMLTDSGGEDEVVASLESGAEDHIAPPFSARLLLARIRVVLRSHAAKDKVASDAIEIRGLIIIPSRREAFLDGRLLELTPTEFDLLLLFATDPGRVFTREEIILEVKGADYPVTKRSVDVQVVGLRKKLGTEGSNIRTVWGVGYAFNA
jgi:two-component system, OmpR family, alkaline phosphatase synthesis response regulator PhoP